MTLRRATADDWATLRDLRLRALREDATAFGSRFAREEAFDDAAWRERLTGAHKATYFALRDGTPAGVATGIDAGDHAELVGMWLAPEARGAGLARALVDAVVAWARDERGARRLVLWVAEPRAPARALYARAGFREPGARMEMKAHPGVFAREMTLAL